MFKTICLDLFLFPTNLGLPVLLSESFLLIIFGILYQQIYDITYTKWYIYHICLGDIVCTHTCPHKVSTIFFLTQIGKCRHTHVGHTYQPKFCGNLQRVWEEVWKLSVWEMSPHKATHSSRHSQAQFRLTWTQRRKCIMHRNIKRRTYSSYSNFQLVSLLAGFQSFWTLNLFFCRNCCIRHWWLELQKTAFSHWSRAGLH